MQTIELSRLTWVIVPALLVVVIQWQWSLRPGTSLNALARMVIQLILIGYVLNYIFAAEHSWYVLATLSIMLIAASWIALRSVAEQRLQLYPIALISTVSVNTLILLLITQFVLNSDPWFAPSVVIPLAGMVFAAGMNAISLFAERYFAELNRGEPIATARNIAFQATMIPITNSLFAVGLVSLPGMMTGQILSGVSPLIAVRYQIMVMLMLFASSGLTAAMFYKLLQKRNKNQK